MPELGKYDYPAVSVGDAIEAAKKIAKQFKATEFNKEALAAALKHSAKSGTFFGKMADLKRFGVIEGRGEGQRATDLALRLQGGGAKEQADAAGELFLRIPLFKALVDRFGGEAPTDDDFRVALQHITGADPVTVQEQAGKIRSLYIEGISKLEGGGAVQTPPSGPPMQLSRGLGGAAPLLGASSGGQPSKIVLQAEDLAMTFPRSPSGLKRLKSVVALLEEQLMEESKSPKEKGVEK